MGKDSVTPFLKYKDKWTILLALTSNSGSRDFQLSEVNIPGTVYEQKLYELVIQQSRKWGHEDQLMFVVGATHPKLFSEIRLLAEDNFLLVPGVGIQGGDLGEISKAGMNDRCGLIVNSSRQIIYASSGEDFAERATVEAKKMQSQMAVLLESLI
jgi:orotidine-5'-phosphate decarboxylase